ncbi:heavy metal-binding protein HIP-like isoform X2 [Mya arenaria]|nr:heavy metal-binding protein HIP-like isoform X2 [Mya arenaria]
MNMKQNLSAMGQQESALLKIVTDLQQTVSTLQEENASLRNKLLTPQVTFMAYLTSSISGNDHHIYFDDVKLNLGNAYNPHHGMFVAPFNGTYQIQVAACSTRLHFIVLECVVNTDIVGKVLAGDGETANCNLNSFFLQLRQGDDVYVRHVSTGDYLYAYSPYENPSFSGTLLHMN